MDESNKNVKNKLGVICTPDYRQLLTNGVILKSQNNQLTSADIGHEFCVLTKTKHVGHDSHSILVPEFEFDHYILKFLKDTEFSESHGICLHCFSLN